MTRTCISFCVAAVTCALSLPDSVRAQQAGEPPSFRFGLSTSVIAQDNRGLDAISRGSTTEFTTSLDFGTTFATPIQQLEVSGSIGLRKATGAESGTLDSGLYNPSLAIGYDRQSRDARFSLNLSAKENDVSSSSVQDLDILNLDVLDPDLVTQDGTRRTFAFDTELELRRRAPFGMTLSTGFTGLRYGDTTSTTLTDQDRFRLGALFRLDLNPSTVATLNLRYSVFEDDGTAEGARETYDVNGALRQTLRNGNVSFLLGATSTEDGDRYTFSIGRTLTTPVWELGATVGITQATNGDLFPSGTLDLSRALLDGSIGASLSQSITSGLDDDEQQITVVGLSYAKQLTSLTSFNADFSFSETNPTGAGITSSLSTVGLSLQHSLTPTWQMNVGLQHLISKGTTGIRARDNRLSVTLRHDLSARR